MNIWLPPSEGKRAPSSGPSLKLTDLSFPELEEPRRAVIEALVSVSTQSTAAELLGLGPKSAADVAVNSVLWDSPSGPAFDVYAGVLYEELGASKLSDLAKSRLEMVTIFSALFGALRPSDLIPNHRLAIGVKLPPFGAMSGWWRPILAPVVQSSTDRPIVDLRSGPYQLAHPARNAHRIEISAATVSGGKRRVISHNAKLWRGRAARFLLEQEQLDASCTLAEVTSALAEWNPGGDAVDVEIGPQEATRTGGSLTRVTVLTERSGPTR